MPGSTLCLAGNRRLVSYWRVDPDIVTVMEQFEAILEAAEHGPGCGIRLPFDPKEVFGRARAQVQVSVNNQDAFATTTMIYGGVAWIGLRRGSTAGLRRRAR
jgi:hypothetical protein